MRKPSRRQYFKAIDDVIYRHWLNFSDQPNGALMREIAESERLFREERWPRPLDFMHHLYIDTVVEDIEKEALAQFPSDAFAGPSLPVAVSRPVTRGSGQPVGWQPAVPVCFWDPLNLLRDHLALHRDLHALEVRCLGVAEDSWIEV
ncbi:hypothetical protein PPGU19_005600 [Paraburkholderia sp. PGU19]|uniref:hypothetical protein n=1 Tax=Paraburkholderia sp. PGU19 TaxID=2735434 RepID=UPI0015DACA3B|nr:hypothetical protein [Paraburkholderia sp. PGU19]BCF95991.1 hypothetical protein PPGU19_005600 [Paraburkholderia sp. PGU19]